MSTTPACDGSIGHAMRSARAMSNPCTRLSLSRWHANIWIGTLMPAISHGLRSSPELVPSMSRNFAAAASMRPATACMSRSGSP